MASPLSTFLPRLSLLSKSLPPQHHRLLLGPTRSELSSFECLAGQTGFFTRLGRLIKEKAKSNVEKLSSGFSKTRDNLVVIDELLLYWNLADTDRILDELEEVFLRDEEYPQVAQASWRQLLQQDKKLSGRHLTRMGTVDPERAYKGSSKKS